MRLSDAFSKIIAYVDILIKGLDKNQPVFDSVKKDIETLIKDSLDFADKNKINIEDYNTAKFAVCAFVDEKILNSNWQEKVKWRGHLLQKKYFNTTNAGKEFFIKLNNLNVDKKEVREVYVLCLALGFTGHYYKEEDKVFLEDIRKTNLKIILKEELCNTDFTNKNYSPLHMMALKKIKLIKNLKKIKF